MLTYERRLDVARGAIDYIVGRSAEEMTRPVPNCPGWTVYNAGVHIGRACRFWEQMMGCTPDDATARDRALEMMQGLPSGVAPAELGRWAHAAIDVMAEEEHRECYFSMNAGQGDTGMWAWHAASELGVHRLDVEDALGHSHSITPDEAVDSAVYACTYVLPTMRGVVGEDPGRLRAEFPRRAGRGGRSSRDRFGGDRLGHGAGSSGAHAAGHLGPTPHRRRGGRRRSGGVGRLAGHPRPLAPVRHLGLSRAARGARLSP